MFLNMLSENMGSLLTLVVTKLSILKLRDLVWALSSCTLPRHLWLLPCAFCYTATWERGSRLA